jgi:hypothetical protein
MGYTKVALEDKILEMYPEILDRKISMSLNFDEKEEAFIIKLSKDGHELTTRLERHDADECMNGTKCVHLGIHIGEFIKNFEKRA